jgi:mRNA-degrading endonuclease RelE of RelBE toxin-antitoxin system
MEAVMATPQILQDITSLPPEAQKQVSDFIAFLKTRYGTVARKKTKRIKLEEEPFVGMWKDREDMKDSAKWVRELRQREWGKK